MYMYSVLSRKNDKNKISLTLPFRETVRNFVVPSASHPKYRMFSVSAQSVLRRFIISRHKILGKKNGNPTCRYEYINCTPCDCLAD
jgi:hypothetical protein